MSDSKSLKVVGSLFFISTISYLVGSGMVENYLKNLDFSNNNFFIALLFMSFNAIAVSLIAIFIYPVIKKHSQRIAMGYLLSRSIETIFLLLEITICFCIIKFPQSIEFSAHIKTIFFSIAMISLGIGSIFLCIKLLQENLVPRMISILGLIGYIFIIFNSIFSLIGLENNFILYLPGAAFEIIFPLWIIFKGFNNKNIFVKEKTQI